MKENQNNRRRFIKDATNTIGGMVIFSAFPQKILANKKEYLGGEKRQSYPVVPRIKFSVIGINHGHINSQVETVTRGGGTLVSFYAKEPDLAADFSDRKS